MGTTEEILSPGNLGGLKVVTAGDLDGPERVLLYSLPGEGKTPLLGSANRVAAFSPCLFINIDREDGPKSIKWLYPEINIIQITTVMDLYKVLEALWNRKGRPYKSFIVDGGTTAQLRGIEHLYRRENEKNHGSIRYFVDPTVPGRSNGGWDKSKSQMTALFDVFCDFDQHVFVTAWARNTAPDPVKMNEPRGELWQPDFTPAVYNAACGRFSSLLFLKRGKTSGQRILKARNTDTSVGRDRGNRLPPTITNPIMADLAKAWNLDDSPVLGGAERYEEPRKGTE